MSSKLQSLMRHNKFPIEPVRKILLNPHHHFDSHRDEEALLNHKDLTEKDYFEFRKIHGNRFDYTLSEVEHLPQQTQLDLINDHNTIYNKNDHRIAKYITETNKKPHPKVLEKTSETLHLNWNPSLAVKKMIANPDTPTNALANLADHMLNSHVYYGGVSFKKLLDHPNMSKDVVKYIHNNSEDEIHDLAKKYL